jgi:hypothetical protein
MRTYKVEISPWIFSPKKNSSMTYTITWDKPLWEVSKESRLIIFSPNLMDKLKEATFVKNLSAMRKS